MLKNLAQSQIFNAFTFYLNTFNNFQIKNGFVIAMCLILLSGITYLLSPSHIYKYNRFRDIWIIYAICSASLTAEFIYSCFTQKGVLKVQDSLFPFAFCLGSSFLIFTFYFYLKIAQDQENIRFLPLMCCLLIFTGDYLNSCFPFVSVAIINLATQIILLFSFKKAISNLRNWKERFNMQIANIEKKCTDPIEFLRIANLKSDDLISFLENLKKYLKNSDDLLEQELEAIVEEISKIMKSIFRTSKDLENIHLDCVKHKRNSLTSYFRALFDFKNDHRSILDAFNAFSRNIKAFSPLKDQFFLIKSKLYKSLLGFVNKERNSLEIIYSALKARSKQFVMYSELSDYDDAQNLITLKRLKLCNLYAKFVRIGSMIKGEESILISLDWIGNTCKDFVNLIQSFKEFKELIDDVENDFLERIEN